MRLFQLRDDVILVRHDARLARAVGVLVAAMGIGAAMAGARSVAPRDPWLALVYVGFLLFGGWMTWVAQPSRHHFDGRRREARLEWRRLLGPSRRERIAFAAIVRAEVEESPPNDDDRMWRVALVLRDGRRVRLTPYWLARHEPQVAAAQAIDALLMAAPTRRG